MVIKKSKIKRKTIKEKIFSIDFKLSTKRMSKRKGKITKITYKKKKRITRPRNLPEIKKESPIKLVKPIYNPIISPSFYPWETKATFNPAAVESNGKIHLLYRAIGDNDSSALGYASTYDGFRIEDRPTYSVYKRYFNYVKYSNFSVDYISGGGWSGGCEDPRLSLIDNTLYMLYTAFDGWGSVRIALTSINFNDFKKKRWNWEKPTLISLPGELSKNWVLFPGKINGKYAILHGISDGILVDYFNDLKELNGNKFIKSISHEDREEAIRKTGIRSVGPTPVRTRLGWLILYHVTEDGKYKMKAMILDLKNPTKILYKLQNPILEPEEHYENNGNKWGVIYSCGAVVKKGKLFVYYGGSDKFVCVASIQLEELLNALKQSKPAKLKNKKRLQSSKLIK